VYDTECIRSQAYERFEDGEEQSMLDGRSWLRATPLAGTSAWANALLQRDHASRFGTDNGGGASPTDPALRPTTEEV